MGRKTPAKPPLPRWRGVACSVCGALYSLREDIPAEGVYARCPACDGVERPGVRARQLELFTFDDHGDQ